MCRLSQSHAGFYAGVHMILMSTFNTNNRASIARIIQLILCLAKYIIQILIRFQCTILLGVFIWYPHILIRLGTTGTSRWNQYITLRFYITVITLNEFNADAFVLLLRIVVFNLICQ